jgi:hypothetical protein
MAEKHSTQVFEMVDIGALEDWLIEMHTISEGMEFVINLLISDRQHCHAANALGVFQKTLSDRLTEGQERFV